MASHVGRIRARFQWKKSLKRVPEINAETAVWKPCPGYHRGKWNFVSHQRTEQRDLQNRMIILKSIVNKLFCSTVNSLEDGHRRDQLQLSVLERCPAYRE